MDAAGVVDHIIPRIIHFKVVTLHPFCFWVGIGDRCLRGITHRVGLWSDALAIFICQAGLLQRVARGNANTGKQGIIGNVIGLERRDGQIVMFYVVDLKLCVRAVDDILVNGSVPCVDEHIFSTQSHTNTIHIPMYFHIREIVVA